MQRIAQRPRDAPMMLALKNSHPRDARIQFQEYQQLPDGRVIKVHRYIIDGKAWDRCSVSSMLALGYPSSFDPVTKFAGRPEARRAAEISNKFKADFSTVHHRHWHRHANHLPYERDPDFPEIDHYNSYEELPGWPHYQRFRQSLEPYWEDWRTEYPMFSIKARLAGTADLILRDMRYPDRLVLRVVDYKLQQSHSKILHCVCPNWASPDASVHRPECLYSPKLASTRDRPCRIATKNATQCAVYATILTDCYGAEVYDMTIAYIHPDYPFHLDHCHVEDYDAIVDELIRLWMSK